jgi:hypothetical protein
MKGLMTPRSAGKLHIGNVLHSGDVFSVEMFFEPRMHFSRQDEIKSAVLAASQHFFRLLHENGFRDHGVPETRVVPRGLTGVVIYIACKAKRGSPAIIKLAESKDPPADAEEKAPSGSPDQVRDQT